MEYTKTLLKEIGLEPERLEMFHIGASDAPLWARAVTEMTERAKEVGAESIEKVKSSKLEASMNFSSDQYRKITELIIDGFAISPQRCHCEE